MYDAVTQDTWSTSARRQADRDAQVRERPAIERAMTRLEGVPVFSPRGPAAPPAPAGAGARRVRVAHRALAPPGAGDDRLGGVEEVPPGGAGPSPRSRGMDFLDRLLRRRKDTRRIVGGLAPAPAFPGGGLVSPPRGRDLPATLVTNRLLLFVLWYINAVLILTVLFVLARNLFKLAVERRHRVLGSKFKTKLVVTYIGLSLIPVLLLFLFAAGLLQGSIERWFNAPARPVLEQGSAVAQALYRRVEEDSLRAAGGCSPRSRSWTSTAPPSAPRWRGDCARWRRSWRGPPRRLRRDRVRAGGGRSPGRAPRPPGARPRPAGGGGAGGRGRCGGRRRRAGAGACCSPRPPSRGSGAS